MQLNKMTALASILGLVLSSPYALAQDIGAHTGEELDTEQPTRPYSPYAAPYSEFDSDTQYPNRVYWGDTHLHTSYLGQYHWGHRVRQSLERPGLRPGPAGVLLCARA